MRQFGDQLNHRFELANGSFGEFRNGQRLINAKTEEDQVAILRELNRHVEKIGEQQRHAEQIQAREQQAVGRKMAISAAMQSPVRSGLEDSYRSADCESLLNCRISHPMFFFVAALRFVFCFYATRSTNPPRAV